MLGVGSGLRMNGVSARESSNTVAASNGLLLAGSGSQETDRPFGASCPGGPVDFYWRTLHTQRLGNW